MVCDTGPLLAAADRRAPDHGIAAALISTLGRELVVLDVVLAEANYLIGARRGHRTAHALVEAVATGVHSAAFLSPGLLRRAVEFDRQYEALRLGLVDSSIMAYAERHRLPILTFDFRDFRATRSRHGPWRLALSENQLG